MGNALREIGATIYAANLYPLGIFEKKVEPRIHPKMAHNPRPVLLVHGIIHNRSAFVTLKRRLEHLGWENIYTMNYRTSHGHIFRMVEDLGHKVDSILKKTGAKQVDIIAHSLGGLVARTYMSLGEGRGKIKRLVTLGTPHQGTSLSFLARGIARGNLHQDLKIDSFLIKLLNQTALPRNSEIVSIFSDFDWTVVPISSAQAVGSPASSIRNIKLDKVGHIGLLYRTEAFDAVVKAILD